MSHLTISYRNPLNKSKIINIPVEVFDNELAKDWIIALKELLICKNYVEKQYSFIGFPKSQRSVEFLCNELNRHIYTINKSELNYLIEDWFSPDTIRYDDTYPVGKGKIGLRPKHNILNRLHNHFEILQGTVEKPSLYYKNADINTKYAIRCLNLLCHELEGRISSDRKTIVEPYWTRPSQITTFQKAKRYNLKTEHRKLFVQNGYDRRFGWIYMHWCQIGKTLYEVYRDENAPVLTESVCSAITHLKYYSGEFDIEFGRDITYNEHIWHKNEINDFHLWLRKNNFDPNDLSLSLGYLPVGRLRFEDVFSNNTVDYIWNKMSDYQDIYQISLDDITSVYDYTWTDPDYEEHQKRLIL